MNSLDPPLVPACMCEGCEYIAPIMDWLCSAFDYVWSRAKGTAPRGLACPRCGASNDWITEGQMPKPDRSQETRAKLRTAIRSLDVSAGLKRQALAALDDPDSEWARELLRLALRAA